MAKGNNFSIFVDVELDTSKIQKQLDQAAKGKKIEITTNADKAAKSINDLDSANRKADESAVDMMLSYQAANAIFQKSVDIITSMVDQVYELDAAQIEFSKVSNMNSEQLNEYTQMLGEMGNSVARTSSEMLNSAGEFRKNGFNDQDSAQLAQVAAMLANVADEEINAGEAASFLISQMVAFDYGAEDAQYIVDAVKY